MATAPDPKGLAAKRSAAAKKAAATRKANARRPGAPPLRPVPPTPAEEVTAELAEVIGAPEEPAEPTPAGRVWEEIRGAAEEVSERRQGPPNITELNRAFGRLLSTSTLAGASYFAETDPRLRTDADIDAAVAALSLSDAEATQVTYPLARLVGRSSVNRRAGRAIVDNVEIGEAASVLVTVALRWRRYLTQRAEALRTAREHAITVTAAPGGRPPAPQPNPFDAGAPVADPAGNGAGVLATPGLVDQIRRTNPR
jgi:hypothetical protein